MPMPAFDVPNAAPTAAEAHQGLTRTTISTPLESRTQQYILLKIIYSHAKSVIRGESMDSSDIESTRTRSY